MEIQQHVVVTSGRKMMSRVECWARDFYADMYVTLDMVDGGKISGGSVRSVTGVCFLTPWKTVQMEIPVLSEDGAAA